MATKDSSSKSGSSGSSSSKSSSKSGTADDQGPDVVNTGDDSDTGAGFDQADEDGPGSPDYPGTVKPTGELVTDDTVEGLDQARRNAGVNPTSEDFEAGRRAAGNDDG